ncbi:MAG: AI-2E family transporter [Lentisphaerae bacterium]|nr:AI-2E family transporter [Lentisphaerota bacterium]
MEEKKGFNDFFQKFLHHGGAGVLASLAIILIFLICATWLKSLIFGLLLAIVLLPLERFFQEKIFRSEKKGFFTRLKEKITKKHLPEEEEKKQLRQKRVFKSSLAAFISFFFIFFLTIYLAFSLLIPQVSRLKDSFVEWGKTSPTIDKVEKRLLTKIEKAGITQEEEGKVVPLRKTLKSFAEENREKLAAFAFSHGQDIFVGIYRLVKGMGMILFDIVLSIFFGFYFLQKIALFEGSGKERRSRTGEWLVNMFFDSPWLPDVSEKTRIQTIRIITHINGILTRWVRGYFIVILIETILYILLFSAGGIPYPLLAGPIAGMTVLLPFIGPVISFCLTVALCIAFCESGLFMTLLIVCIIYLLINGLLEQFFLYPVFIGEVSGLTTVETIIVVLLGGITAGISGMIFAVPAAAIIKYIVPVIYRASSLKAGEKNETT